MAYHSQTTHSHRMINAHAVVLKSHEGKSAGGNYKTSAIHSVVEASISTHSPSPYACTFVFTCMLHLAVCGKLISGKCEADRAIVIAAD